MEAAEITKSCLARAQSRVFWGTSMDQCLDGQHQGEEGLDSHPSMSTDQLARWCFIPGWQAGDNSLGSLEGV